MGVGGYSAQAFMISIGIACRWAGFTFLPAVHPRSYQWTISGFMMVSTAPTAWKGKRAGDNMSCACHSVSIISSAMLCYCYALSSLINVWCMVYGAKCMVNAV